MISLKNLFLPSTEHTIHTVRDRVTQIVTSEEWYNKNGKLDRTDGPASISRDGSTGNIIREAWYRDGKRVLPSAEIRETWLKNSDERINCSTEQRATWLIGEKPTMVSP